MTGQGAEPVSAFRCIGVVAAPYSVIAASAISAQVTPEHIATDRRKSEALTSAQLQAQELFKSAFDSGCIELDALTLSSTRFYSEPEDA
jgi:hypothetical protein